MTHQPDATEWCAIPAPPPAGHLAIAAHYALNYHPGTLNYCPGCAGTHWLIGRVMAQCARCDTALPLAQVAETPVRPLFVSHATRTIRRSG
ncbi:MAG TPA: hypothetical protein VFF84_07370 [Sphingobium sp.]|nr:hypothetical protein [Sphingobium sp.]